MLGALVALLILLGVVALVLLAEANTREQRVVDLQRRSIAYADLRLETTTQLYAVETALASRDPKIIDAAARQLGLTGYSVDRLQFVASEEADLVARVVAAHDQFAVLNARTLDLVNAGQIAEAQRVQTVEVQPVEDRLERLTNELVDRAQAEVAQSIEDSRDAYARSQAIVLAFAGLSFVLAIVLGLALGFSIIRPLGVIGARVERIAGGEFTGTVRIDNRDELGALAVNVDRMSDQLGQLYADLEAANRNKSIFLANMSHELRTPLNAIIGFSEVLLQQMFGPLNEKQTEYTRDVLVSGQHLLGLINDVLDLSKVEAGKMELESGVVAVGPLLDGSVTMIRERAAKHSISVAVTVGANVGDIQADERKLRQVLYNLLSNAVKFTPELGRIDVNAVRVNGEVRVSVKDTGVGIAPADQARIFEKFVQAESGRRQEASTGLGLALAKSLVELHGGRIWVESVPGAGSTFTFSVPSMPAA